MAEGRKPSRSRSSSYPAQLVPDLPLPRPMFETFVYAPEMEGVHLRAGRVARGGGALVRPARGLPDRDPRLIEGTDGEERRHRCRQEPRAGSVVKSALSADPDVRYAQGRRGVPGTFVRGCWTITRTSSVVRSSRRPTSCATSRRSVPRRRCRQGTATFSDLANAISSAYGFWLGDASPPEAPPVTTTRRWASRRGGVGLGPPSLSRSRCRRGSRGLTVVGIGDMSGDVFGNGMLQSEHLRLVAAFDHRHVFLDPTPDPAASFAERKRLFELPRSSWADYDPSIISPGGGSSPGLRSGSCSPRGEACARHCRRVARAGRAHPGDPAGSRRPPVERGIGTYVKADDETNAEVADKTNDSVG